MKSFTFLAFSQLLFPIYIISFLPLACSQVTAFCTAITSSILFLSFLGLKLKNKKKKENYKWWYLLHGFQTYYQGKIWYLQYTLISFVKSDKIEANDIMIFAECIFMPSFDEIHFCDFIAEIQIPKWNQKYDWI